MVVMVVVPDCVGIGAGAMAGWVCIVDATTCCCCCRRKQTVINQYTVHQDSTGSPILRVLPTALHLTVTTITDMFAPFSWQ
jgi:hypothetical protein